MYQVFLLITFLAYCSSIPFSGSNSQRSTINAENDDMDLVDSAGAGYSYFKKQQVDARPLAQPSLDISSQDLSAYMQSSALTPQQQILSTERFSMGNNPIFSNAFGQQQLIPRSNMQIQTFLPKPIQIRQPGFSQKDFTQFPSTFSDGYGGQQANLPIQSNLLASNTFGNQQQQQQQQDLQSQQIVFPRNNFNMQQKTFNSYDNQQQDLPFVQQPQQTWNNQQQSTGFTSSFGGQGQQPVSSSYFIQSNQQNDQQPITNAVFMSSQLPTQRFISQPKQQIFNNGGW